MKKIDEQKTHQPVVGLIDLGSNSVRLLIVRINANRSHTVLTRYKQMVRLGEGVFETGRLSSDAMARTVEAMRGIVDICRGYDVQETVAYATAAVRDAGNARAFTEHVADETGIRLSVISGLEEARLIHLGVASELPETAKGVGLFVDIGGGSTEVAVGRGMQFLHLDSIKLGAVRVAGWFPASTGPGPVSPTLYAKMRAHIRDSAIRSIQKLHAWQPAFMAGSSGTIVNLAVIASRLKKKQNGGQEGPQKSTLSYKALVETARRLCVAPLEQRRKFPGLNPQRADIIVAGAAILQTIMEETGMESLLPSNRGLLEGMLVDYLARGTHGYLKGDASVREESVTQLARACSYDETHASWTACLAEQLFDSGKKCGLHNYGREERELLRHAATLHDIGLFLSFSDHHAHTRYMVEHSDLLGFSRREVALMAWTAFFHRKWQPPKGEGAASFAALTPDDRERALVLGAFLRLSECLDRSQQQTVASARFEKQGKKLVLRVALSKPSPTELLALEETHAPFRKRFGRDFSVQADSV